MLAISLHGPTVPAVAIQEAPCVLHGVVGMCAEAVGLAEPRAERQCSTEGLWPSAEAAWCACGREEAGPVLHGA